MMFEMNWTKIKGDYKSGRKKVTHSSKSDLPLAIIIFLRQAVLEKKIQFYYKQMISFWKFGSSILKQGSLMWNFARFQGIIYIFNISTKISAIYYWEKYWAPPYEVV